MPFMSWSLKVPDTYFWQSQNRWICQEDDRVGWTEQSTEQFTGESTAHSTEQLTEQSSEQSGQGGEGVGGLWGYRLSTPGRRP
jgi:hypothetical protein